MTDKHRYQKHNKLRKKRDRIIEKQQLHFIDADVFIGTLLAERKKKTCDDLLYSFRGKQRKSLTSTHAIGEVVKRIHTAQMDNSLVKTGPLMNALNFIISTFEIEIYNVDNKTLELVKKAVKSDTVCGFKDAINIAVGYQYGCVCFHTTDKNISPRTLKEFEMKRMLITD